MKLSGRLIFISVVILVHSCSPFKPGTTRIMNDNFIEELLRKHPEYFHSILNERDTLNVQVIYTRIDRNREGRATFTDHYFNVDDDNYFYPASTVKLPVAILALQRINELNIPGLNMHSTMITEAEGPVQTIVDSDTTSENGRSSIAHYIKKILLVSDNDAFNRLYEFLGQEYINNSLHQMGYKDVQIIHRLSLPLSEEDNRHSNPVKFYDNAGQLLYATPSLRSKLVYARRDTRLGKGYMSGSQLVNEPFDFSKKNRMPLTDLHNILRSIMFPADVPTQHRFNLTKDDYEFLYRYMSMYPSESNFPKFDKVEYPDTYVKHYMYGKGDVAVNPAIRIFNKTGDAYGFLIDASYVAGFDDGVEFMLTTVIPCNSDGTFNDDHYDYDSIGYPFLKNLGLVVYEYDKNRTRQFKPDLSALRMRENEK